MPKTNSTTLTEHEIKMISVLLMDMKNNNQGPTMDWTPYLTTFGYKDNKAAKDAFAYIMCKVKNIVATTSTSGDGAGPATPNNSAPASASSKKKKTATGSRKLKAPVSSANGDDSSGSQADDTPAKKKRVRRAATPKPVKAEEEAGICEMEADNIDEA